MRKYRIALVTDKYLPIFGGLELLLHDLAIELRARGHEPHIICTTPADDDAPAVGVTRLKVPRLLYRARSARALVELEGALRTGDFDLIHAHCVFSPLAHAATLLARRLGKPSVFTLHSVLGGVGGIAMSLVDRALGWSRWPTILTAVSHYVSAQLRALSSRPVELLRNAVHAERWARERHEELRVVGAMRFTMRKRPLDFVRAVPYVMRHLPASRRPIFTLVGDGPERRAVEREVARLGIGDLVELPGAMSRDEMAQLYARSALFAVPSPCEALSIAAIEARAAGLPVVAYAGCGVSEVIDHGVHGLLARHRADFAEHLATLLADDALRARMSSESRRNLERFSWPTCVERYEHIYSLACEQHAQR